MVTGAPLCAFLAAIAAGCAHVTHPARVTPGYSADMVVAPAIERYEDHGDPADAERDLVYDLQFNARYGWTRGEGRGIQVEAMMPMGRYPEKFGPAWLIGSWIAVYRQFRGNPDLGAGLLVGLSPGLYGLIGRTWQERVDLAAGARLNYVVPNGSGDHGTLSGAVFSTLAYRAGSYRGGLLIEHMEQSKATKECDEVCEPSDYLRRRSSIGLFVGRSWD